MWLDQLMHLLKSIDTLRSPCFPIRPLRRFFQLAVRGETIIRDEADTSELTTLITTVRPDPASDEVVFVNGACVHPAFIW